MMLAGVAPAEVVSAEVPIRLVAGEDVVGGDEDGMADGDRGFGGAAAATQPRVLGGEIGGLGARRRLRGLAEVAAQPLGALARRAAPPLAGGFMESRTHPGPRRDPHGGADARPV